jgi:tetratricopeptide (TPR) repeat protein
MPTEPNAGLDLVETLTQALALHRAGQLGAAAAHYETVLAVDPDQPNALYLLGSLRMGEGRFGDASSLLDRAAQANPDHADTLLQLGNARFRQGDVAGARASWSRLVELRPGLAEAHANLARAALAEGDVQAAIAAGRAAVSLNPELAEGWTNLGNAQLAGGVVAEAIDSYRAALTRQDTAQAQANLANAMHRAGALQPALAGAELALDRAPDLLEARLVQTRALRDMGHPAEARSSAEKAVAIAPDSAAAVLALGNALFDLDRLDEAASAYHRALELDPGLAEAHANLGFLHTAQGRYQDAIAACERAVALRPDFAEAHWNQGFAHLLAGDYPPGWAKYEWRKRHPRFAAAFARLAGPEWSGEPLAGKRLLVHAEQGLGDCIHFVRFAPALAASGAAVVMACARPLVSLIARAPGVAEAVDRDLPLPDYDLWVDQMSLPHLLQVTPDSTPAPDRYLAADPAHVVSWRQKRPEGLVAGLVWSGNPFHSNDHRRSMPSTALAPLLDVPGWRFASLQVGPRAAEVTGLPGVVDYSEALVDFEATAALIETLDVVIAVDTAVAHLAGAMGRSTFLLLPFAPDWRWPPSRPDDTAWYPSMRLFRQTQPGDWGAVVARVAAALATFQRAS